MKQLTNYKRCTGYLDKIFKLLNAEYFDGKLPSVIITIQSTPKAYGHFTAYDAWHTENEGFKEINIGAGTLDRPIENVTATLLHEMVHEYCLLHGIKDTSRAGQYHNKRFKQEAEKRGLHIDYNSRIGWSVTEPTDSLLAFCIDNSLEDIKISREEPTGAAKRLRQSSYRRYVCPVCGCIARTTKDATLICGNCSEVMVLS